MNETKNASTHPVLILIGQLEVCHQTLQSILQERGPIYSQIKYLDIEHDTLPSFFEFISVYSFTRKLVVGTIRKDDPHVITALLKKIEDPPHEVDFIFIGARFPRVMLTRGIVQRVYSTTGEIKEQVLLEQYLLTALREGKFNKLEAGYKTWHKVLEVRKWIESGQITQENGVLMMRSLMEVAKIRLPITT
jgi:hypothetical protein